MSIRFAFLRPIFLVTVLGLVTAGSLYGQEAISKAQCEHPQRLVSVWYYERVMERLEPGDSHPGPVTITIVSIPSEDPESKFILNGGPKGFELVKGRAEQNVYNSLLDLDGSCRLPPNPDDAAKTVRTKWERLQLSSVQFAQLHQEFVAALASYDAEMKDRYEALIETGKTTVTLHSTNYLINYNNGEEQIEITANSSQSNGRTAPAIVNWANRIAHLREEKPHPSATGEGPPSNVQR